MINYWEAVVAFFGWQVIAVGTTYLTLGEAGVMTFIPIWVLSLLYPFMKRLTSFPQVILGAVIGGAVFPGWASVTGNLHGLDQALPLFAATMCWVVYFDVFYATQVSMIPSPAVVKYFTNTELTPRLLRTEKTTRKSASRGLQCS